MTQELIDLRASILEGRDEDALIIVDAITDLVKDIQSWAEISCKQKNPINKFLLYKSDVVIGSNCIHVDMGKSSVAFISFNSVNSLSTSNSTFCEETNQWTKNLIKKSTLLSGTAEKQRYQFFNQIYKKIEAVKKNIESF